MITTKFSIIYNERLNCYFSGYMGNMGSSWKKSIADAKFYRSKDAINNALKRLNKQYLNDVLIIKEASITV